MNNSNPTKSRSTLRERFQAGDKPTQSDFSMIFDQTIHQQEDKIVVIKESGGVSLTIGEDEKDKLLINSAASFKKGITTNALTIDGSGQDKLLVRSKAIFEQDLTASSVTIGENTSGKLLVKSDATFEKGLSADSVTINGIGQGALQVKGEASFEKDLTIGSVAIDGSEQGKLLVKNDATFKKGLTASSVTIGENTLGNLQVKSDATFEKNLTTRTLTVGNGTTISQVINTNMGSVTEAASSLATVQAIREYVTDNAVGLTQYDNAEAVVTINLPISDGANGYKGIPSNDASVDGAELIAGNLVLLTNQTDKTHNHLWEISAGYWKKKEKLQTGSAVFIKQGDINGGTLWIMKSTDIANPQWVRRADLDYLKAGVGLNKNGQTLSLKTPANSGLICDGNGLALNIQQLFVFLPETATPADIQAKLNAGAIFVGTYKVS
ncbi:hypothetical protein R6242_21495 [Iodobacter sp. CM08]|uniref:hypothetical protein n=1 Tax=Iodobacter sp. CM08 TaxID=3085902 RepID=UPI002981C784|nr:hypothetical protein [Iodobacter sp. CM08]MDW5419152.1 hypothetical protein [Iodobacter sp. CM08]